MVPGHIWAQILNAHGNLPEPVNELPQGPPILLANVDQGNGGQVMRSAGGELCIKLGHQFLKTVNGVMRELRKPVQNLPSVM